jgi:hypothetical protein
MWVITFTGFNGTCDWRITNILDASTNIKLCDVQWVFDDYAEAVKAREKCDKFIEKPHFLQIYKFCDLPYREWKMLCDHIRHFEWSLKAIDPSYNMGSSRKKNIINVIKPREKERKFFVIYDDIGDNRPFINPKFKEIFEQGRHYNVTILDPKEWADNFNQNCFTTIIGERKAGRSTIFGDLQKLWDSLTEEEQNKIEAQAYGEAVGKDLDHWQNLTPEERNEILTRKPFKL